MDFIKWLLEVPDICGLEETQERFYEATGGAYQRSCRYDFFHGNSTLETKNLYSQDACQERFEELRRFLGLDNFGDCSPGIETS